LAPVINLFSIRSTDRKEVFREWLCPERSLLLDIGLENVLEAWDVQECRPPQTAGWE
jgi:hypothetical protein